MQTQDQPISKVATDTTTASVAMDSVAIEDAELNELYAGPRQDVTH